MDDKLNLLMAAINKINTNFHYKFDELQKVISNDEDGILSWLTTVERLQEELTARVDDFEGQLPQVADLSATVSDLSQKLGMLQDDLETLKGFAQVQEKQIASNKSKLIDLTARNMSNNVIISGITGDGQEENCKVKVLEFLKNTLTMEVKDKEVLVAHCMGKFNVNGAKPRAIVVRCVQKLRDTIFQYTKNLKDVRNDLGDVYYVNVQLPEALAVQKRQCEDKFWQIRSQNEAQTDQSKKVQVQIKNCTLYIDKVPQLQFVFPTLS